MLSFKLLSALEKVFPCEAPTAPEYTGDSCLRGERFYFQAAVYNDSPENHKLTVTADSPLKAATKLYAVKFVPTTFPAYPGRKDDNYLKTEPGLFPDLLWPLEGTMTIPGGQWRCLWVEIDTGNFDGPCPISLQLDDCRLCFDLQVLPVSLPRQSLLNTQWLHCDCLATQYGVPVFSPEHWSLLDRYMENAATYGTNMILTPVVTPPLDTEVGAERPTVQLVQITLEGDEYSFDFSLLDRYIRLAQGHGITHFEIAHLFTQWGAGFAPKIMVCEKGEIRRRFGWDTAADSPEYTAFLSAFLPALKQHLKDLGVFENCFFHVSDEPEEKHLESYSRALAVVAPLYSDCRVIDALSEYRFYAQGLVRTPVVAVDHIEPFLAEKVPDLWAYYCCAQCVDVSNRFLAQPSARNRILAYQLFKFDITGFLHWGYNFWYSQNSRGPIDPFAVTDAGEAFPGGDPFLVYPGPDGSPLPSIRQMVFHQALQDLQALCLLNQKMEKGDILAQLGAEDITFSHYPKDSEFLLTARRRINEKIAALFV